MDEEDRDASESDISGVLEPLLPKEDAYKSASEEEDAWLPDAISNFGRSVSSFGSLHLLLEAWTTDVAQNYLAGKTDSTTAQPLDRVGQEVCVLYNAFPSLVHMRARLSS